MHWLVEEDGIGSESSYFFSFFIAQIKYLGFLSFSLDSVSAEMHFITQPEKMAKEVIYK